MRSDTANQTRPFVLYNTLGEFLRKTSIIFLCITLVLAINGAGDKTTTNHTFVIYMLANVFVIATTLEINSKRLFLVCGCLAFVSVLAQIVVVLVTLFRAPGMSSNTNISKIVLSIVIAIVILAIVISVVLQLFCSAAMIKLSEVMDHPKHVEKEKESTRRERRRRSDSDSFSSSPSFSDSIKSIETHTCSSECQK
ncbi:unnamed protein product [Caenorhabditis sp. 36 PRJEB53466]|nr:unnamed protein product [Caenorhabditis sp. 36 PRJEB53466]